MSGITDCRLGGPIRSQIARGKIFKLGNLEVHDPFLGFLRSHSEVALKVAEILSNIYYATYREVRYLGLAGSVQEKLASFWLDFAARHASNNGQKRVVLTLTHEEIAAIIGSSQETLTRQFADFRRKGLVQIRRSTLVLADKTGL
jgi:CRP-like cAMP-binding protein